MATPIKIDCKNLRLKRQWENNQLLARVLITQNQELVRYHCNNNELDRVLAEITELREILSMQPTTIEQVLYKCHTDFEYAIVLAGRISKVASRQAVKDESYILNKCNETVSKVGIKIENLTKTAFRPTKDGRILNNEEYKKSGLKKSDCLKSFDARITGKVNGWVFAKVAFGKGGHQDNVFSEACKFGEWVQKHGREDELYVVLIDTDLALQFQDLRLKFNQPNIIVCNHVEFQQYCLDKFS